jgi:N-methylhydantoinase A
LSHELVSEYREYERLSTTVINAYVQPVMSRHLDVLRRGLRKSRLRVMQSNGGTISAAQAEQEAVRTVLSGPAAGVIGAWRVAQSLGIKRAITFDMGGTSTDVSLIKVPALEIHTVGAGGGSIARVDSGGALKVGPESAGADPGPACYGKGENATVTDANLVLGRLVAHRFLDGTMQLDTARARRVLAVAGRGMKRNAEQTAEGIVEVANSSMERAIRRISVERGHDPRECTLIAFGGAAGQHACDLAANLAIRRIVAPRHPGLLSAWGAAAADPQRNYVHTVRLVNPPAPRLRRLFVSLGKRGRAALRAEDVASRNWRFDRSVDVRYQGQSHEIRLPLTADYLEQFHDEHARLYGYCDRQRPVEVVNLRLAASGRGPKSPVERLRTPPRSVSMSHRIRWRGRWLKAALFLRDQLRPRSAVKGPAIIAELSATTFVAPGWRATLLPSGHLEIVHGD